MDVELNKFNLGKELANLTENKQAYPSRVLSHQI